MEREQQEAIGEESKQLEKLANKRSLLLNKVRGGATLLGAWQVTHSVVLQKEDSMRKIRELGSLPADAFEKYMKLTLSQVSPFSPTPK